jgi:hypothetical protein
MDWLGLWPDLTLAMGQSDTAAVFRIRKFFFIQNPDPILGS